LSVLFDNRRRPQERNTRVATASFRYLSRPSHALYKLSSVTRGRPVRGHGDPASNAGSRTQTPRLMVGARRTLPKFVSSLRNTNGAYHVLSRRALRRNCAFLSPRPVPKICGPRQAIPNAFCSRDFGAPGQCSPWSPSVSRRCSVRSEKTVMCGQSLGLWPIHTRRLLVQEGLGNHRKGPFCRYLSPLPDSNRRPPPYHGGALPTELRGQPHHCRPGSPGLRARAFLVQTSM
jgi:hypothetical protein